MKKYLAMFLTMVMGVSVLTGCGGGAAEAPADDAERTTFTVGFDAEYPPYGYRTEDGDYAGFDLDLAAEVCARQGWELVKQSARLEKGSGRSSQGLSPPSTRR